MTSLIPLFRFYRPMTHAQSDGADHMYTEKENEFPSVPQGPTRCMGPDSEGGYSYSWYYEGIECAILSDPSEGTVPLNRWRNDSLGNHAYTVDSDTPQGYVSEGIVGHVYPTQVPGTIPLYRYYSSPLGDNFYTTRQDELAHHHGSYVFERIECYVIPTKVIDGVLEIVPVNNVRIDFNLSGAIKVELLLTMALIQAAFFTGSGSSRFYDREDHASYDGSGHGTGGGIGSPTERYLPTN